LFIAPTANDAVRAKGDDLQTRQGNKTAELGLDEFQVAFRIIRSAAHLGAAFDLFLLILYWS
jgi:hypothetical protein